MYTYLVHYGFNTYTKVSSDTIKQRIPTSGRMILSLDFPICSQKDIKKVESILQEEIHYNDIDEVMLFSFNELQC